MSICYFYSPPPEGGNKNDTISHTMLMLLIWHFLGSSIHPECGIYFRSEQLRDFIQKQWKAKSWTAPSLEIPGQKSTQKTQLGGMKSSASLYTIRTLLRSSMPHLIRSSSAFNEGAQLPFMALKTWNSFAKKLHQIQ